MQNKYNDDEICEYCGRGRNVDSDEENQEQT